MNVMMNWAAEETEKQRDKRADTLRLRVVPYIGGWSRFAIAAIGDCECGLQGRSGVADFARS